MADALMPELLKQLAREEADRAAKLRAAEARQREIDDVRAGLKSGRYQATGQTLTEAQKREPPVDLRRNPDQK